MNVAGNTPLQSPTSNDVARRAGVSQSAVSLVLAGKSEGRVGKRTQEAILQAAHELGYYPNSAARTLRSGRSHLIALAIPDVSNPYFANVLQGAEQAARANGYFVMLAQIRDERDWQHMVLDVLTSRTVDGFIFCEIEPPKTDEYRVLREKSVMVNAGSGAFSSLQLDVTTGMHTVMTHLFQLGHRKIAHLAAHVDTETFHLRHQAYLDAVQQAGYPTPDQYQERASFHMPEAYQAAYRLLNVTDPPSAIVCDSDVFAVGVYKAARDLQRAIPQDVSVVSFDDSLIAQILEPALTTVVIPASALGEQALHLLLEVLAKRQVSPQTTVPLELVVRASTTVVRSGK